VLSLKSSRIGAHGPCEGINRSVEFGSWARFAGRPTQQTSSKTPARQRVQIVQSDRDLVELRFTRAYIELFDAPINAVGAKTASLVRFGKYEVRLIRFARALSTGALPIWLELYSHETQSVIDSCGSHDRAQALQAAADLASRARTLDDESRKVAMVCRRLTRLLGFGLYDRLVPLPPSPPSFSGRARPSRVKRFDRKV
jgi:hypothetical protein